MPAEVIAATLPHAPQEPGVYLMKDAKGRIIYVGKAKRLRARLASYTRQDQAPTWYRHKILTMVSQVAAVDFIVTTTEKEALLLESTLIKEHRPRYNADLKDDKSYPYFRLSVADQFPRFSLVRRPNPNDGAKYFGPFESAGAARKTLELLQRIFPLRRCSDRAIANRTRPCLDHEMRRCPAPCAGRITPEDYRQLVRQVEAFFAGQGEVVAEDLLRAMQQAAAGERFEEAALLRDRWQALTRTLERQRVARSGGEDADVVALHEDESGARLAVVKVRAGRVIDSQVHDLSQATEPADELLGQALLLLYTPDTPPPPLLLLSLLPADPSLVAEVLAERAGRKVELRHPQRGEKRELMELAVANASRPRAAGPEIGGVLASLAAKLGLAGPPARMECVDISHLGGKLTVASLVAMKDGAPDKSGYRHYKVLGAEGAPDDFAAMAEVVARRLGGDLAPPDLLVVDGGKGQLGAALAAMEGLAPERRPPLAALAKGKQGQPDRVFLPGRKNPAALKPRDPGLLLLMRLRDEAHRFAITFHRALRRKALTRSILEEVPGVGPKKRAQLFKAMGSLAAIRRATAEQMAAAAGLDLPTAQRVAAFLASLDTPPGQE